MRACIIIIAAVIALSQVCPAYSGPKPKMALASEYFTCADSLARADGLPRQSSQCHLSTEYCYEASGGAALSHGAKCLPLPMMNTKTNTNCVDLQLPPGARCEGAAASGLTVHVALP